MGLEPFRIVRMSRSRKALVSPSVETDAEVIERGAVCIEAFTVRPVYRNKLGHQVDYLTELCFLFPDLSFCRLAIFNVGEDAVPFDDVADFIAQRDATLQMPAILPVRTPETHLVLTSLAAGNAREPLSL